MDQIEDLNMSACGHLLIDKDAKNTYCGKEHLQEVVLGKWDVHI